MRLLIFACILATTASAQPSLVSRTLITSDAQMRSYLVHHPVGFVSHSSTPVLLAFHGGLGNAAQFATSTPLRDTSDTHGFLLVYPNGTPLTQATPNSRTWNAGECCGSSATNTVDDLLFVRELVDALDQEWGIDRSRVYATGLSNGGLLSYRLAVELADVIAAAAPVAAALATSAPLHQAIPLLAIHGALDTSVPPAGGLGAGVSGYEFRSQAESLAPFLVRNRAALPVTPTRVVGQAQYTESAMPVTGAPVGYWWLLDQGHSWPGVPSVGTPGVPFNTDIDAGAEIWTFCSRFTREPRTTRLESGSGSSVTLSSSLGLLGEPSLVHVAGLAPGQSVLVLVSPPFGGLSLAGFGVVWVDPMNAAILGSSAPPATSLTLTIPLPDDPSLRGTEWMVQAAASAPLRLTDASAIVLGY